MITLEANAVPADVQLRAELVPARSYRWPLTSLALSMGVMIGEWLRSLAIRRSRTPRSRG
jgi:hypothetical protein